MRFQSLKPRWQRSQKEEADYFSVEVNCLGCSKLTQLRMNTAHNMLRCRSCGTIMHLDSIGTWQIGPPPALVDQSSETSRPVSKPRFRRLRRLIDRFPLLRNRWVLGAISLLIVAGIFAVVYRVRAGSQIKVPHTLRGRAIALGKAIAEDDEAVVKQLQDPDAADAMQSWRASIVKKLDAMRRKTVGAPKIRAKVFSEKESTQRAVVQCAFEFPGVNARRLEDDIPKVEFITHWKRNSSGEWVLDAARSLKAAQ